MPNAPSTKSDCKGLWAVFWRMFLIAPLIGIFGSIFLFFIIGMYLLPVFAITSIIAGNYICSLITMALWLAWLRSGRKIKKLAADGWNYSSL